MAPEAVLGGMPHARGTLAGRSGDARGTLGEKGGALLYQKSDWIRPIFARAGKKEKKNKKNKEGGPGNAVRARRGGGYSIMHIDA